jgi:ABC-type lipoprotein export system ATPase subunit
VAIALECSDITKSYRARRATSVDVLRGISFTVAAGEWLALTGKSGSGKTTLLQILGTLDEMDEGALTCFGEDLRRMGWWRRAAFRCNTLGFIFQSYHLFPELTALENVTLAGRVAGAVNRQRALELIDRVGLADRLEHRPAELSGGEQQRIAIARALMNKPRLLLADEPTGNLDAGSANAIMQILRDIREAEDLTIIMVTHDPRLSALADRAMHIEKGQLMPRAALAK